jgi:histidine triad (HIT) family protein
MYNHAPKNYDCSLCKIAKGEVTELGDQEQDVVYRDQYVTAYIAGKWWNSNPGHVLIITNKHIEKFV